MARPKTEEELRKLKIKRRVAVMLDLIQHFPDMADPAIYQEAIAEAERVVCQNCHTGLPRAFYNDRCFSWCLDGALSRVTNRRFGNEDDRPNFRCTFGPLPAAASDPGPTSAVWARFREEMAAKKASKQAAEQSPLHVAQSPIEKHLVAEFMNVLQQDPARATQFVEDYKRGKEVANKKRKAN